MPCTDGGPCCGFTDHITLAKHKEELDELQVRLDYVTEMFCRVMAYSQSTGLRGTPLARDVLSLHPGLPKWWNDHQKKDAKEKAIQDAELAVKKAMAQLKKLREE